MGGSSNLKFQPGDRFRGRADGVKAWIREQEGVVLAHHPATGEYHVRLDNGEDTYVRASWIERNARRSS